MGQLLDRLKSKHDDRKSIPVIDYLNNVLFFSSSEPIPGERRNINCVRQKIIQRMSAQISRLLILSDRSSNSSAFL